MAFADAPRHHQSRGVHNQDVCSPGKAKRSISSPLAAAAPGLHSPVGICISSKHRLSLVWGSKKKDIFFFLFGYLCAFYNIPKVAFSAWRSVSRSSRSQWCADPHVQFKGKEQNPVWRNLHLKATTLFCLNLCFWLTLSGDNPGALLLYLWGQAAEVFLSWKQ